MKSKCFLLALLAAIIALPSAPAAAMLRDDCNGCQVTSTAVGGSQPSGGWTITVVLTTSAGACLAVAESNPLNCAPVACTGTATFTVVGPANTTYAAGYQTQSSQHYTVTPPPSTDANGNGTVAITKRAGCGGTLLLDANGPNGEAWTWGLVECSGCTGGGQ